MEMHPCPVCKSKRIRIDSTYEVCESCGVVLTHSSIRHSIDVATEDSQNSSPVWLTRSNGLTENYVIKMSTLVDRLAKEYKSNCVWVACLCDGVLDKSGRLLEEVRKRHTELTFKLD